jgi:hypothetical protein
VTKKEADNRRLFRIRHPEYAALIEAPENVPRWIGYLDGIAEAVEKEGGTYLEMSEEIDPDSDDTLFCDMLHPNETGAKLMRPAYQIGRAASAILYSLLYHWDTARRIDIKAIHLWL